MSAQNWKFWSSSVAGPLHLRNGLPNQDACITQRFCWGEVVVVADGLGSKKNSDIGSKTVCESVVEAAKFVRRTKNVSYANIPQLIHALWRIKIGQYTTHDCATTCIFVIRFEKQFVLGQIGDGMLVGLGQSPKNDFILQTNMENEFSNLTNCLGEEFHYDDWTLKIVPVDQIIALILCTDGIADDLLPERRIDFARELWGIYRSTPIRRIKTEIHNMLTNWTVPYHTDDKTIVCLYR
ncbi:MAG: protein phosphatase 2C domain-containing protein [Planctomycetaceae bacterium]|jgi:serine/threonine protein phosphatase PrpC|nr:protein phosphatase 2C domain-containing protein [Planctomycetaceae bacterium]